MMKSDLTRRYVSPLLWAVLVLCVSWGICCSTGYGQTQQLLRIEALVNGQRLTLAVAATPESRRSGLSGYDHLPENEGMLFVLPRPRPFSFWMKDTLLPLSIAFLDDQWRIISIERMAPGNADKIYQSPQPVRYAVEVNSGWFAEHHVGVGDLFEIQLPMGLRID